jgi:hypothetical protein
MAKKIMKILCFLTVFVILTSAVQIPVFALTDDITSVSYDYQRTVRAARAYGDGRAMVQVILVSFHLDLWILRSDQATK